jgi:outer membrane protein assembly factor BamB
VEWSEEKNIKWKVAIPGTGHATPVTWENQIFVLTAEATGKEQAAPAIAPATERRTEPSSSRRGRGMRRPPPPTSELAFTILSINRQTGETVWKQVCRKEVPHEGHHSTTTFASASAVTDGEHVFAFFGSRGLYCFDMKGDLQWEKDLGDMNILMTFGEGSSPTVSGDTVVVVWDHEGDSFVYALNKRSGEVLWQKSRDERTSWATPAVAEHEGKKQVIVSATGAVRGYDLETGDVLWECGGMTRNVIPTPPVDQGIVYVMSGFRGSAAKAIRLGGRGDLTDTDAVIWSLNRGTPYVPSPVLYRGTLYFCQITDGILTCLDALSGEPYYSQERLEHISSVYASPVAADERIYLVGREGTTVVLKHSTELEILATNTLDDPIDASPAIVGDELLLRGHQHLYCITKDTR